MKKLRKIKKPGRAEAPRALLDALRNKPLSAEEIAEIKRQTDVHIRELARRYGVTVKTIEDIREGRLK